MERRWPATRLRLLLAALLVMIGCSATASSPASASPLTCSAKLSVNRISCGQAGTVMSALIGSYAVGDPARFRYGSRHWVCRYAAKPKHGQLLFRCVSNKVWFHAYWRANWNQGNDTCPSPDLEDDFDGNTSTQLSIVDFEHTPGVSCDRATAMFTAMYQDNQMRASDGHQTYTWHALGWNCQTSGAPGVAQTNWWSDISITCTSLPTKVTNLVQWLTLELGMVPVISCTGNTTYGPPPDCDSDLTVGHALDDSDLPQPIGPAAAGLHWEDYSSYTPGNLTGASGNMLVPTAGAINHYALCVWRDVGPQNDGGVTEEGYVCTYGGE
jgi:hypothetical protein